MRNIENRDNETIAQIKTLINKSFPPAFGYRLEYFVGEDEDTGNRYLIFHIMSSAIGNIYRKSLRLNPHKSIMEQENDFIGAVLSDFLLLGTTFLTNNIMAQRAAQHKDSDNILKNPFSKSRLNNIILN